MKLPGDGDRVMDFQKDDRVLYVPMHVSPTPEWKHADHPDCEWGTVSSATADTVFVQFDAQVRRVGWAGATAKACDRSNLLKKEASK